MFRKSLTAFAVAVLGLNSSPASAGAPPASTEVFASAHAGNSEVYRQSAGGTIARVTDDPAFAFVPAMSPDGRTLAFASDRDGDDAEVYLVRLDDYGLTRLTTSPGFDVNPAFSPDGTKIAFVSRRDGNEEIYVVQADGSGQTRLTADPARDFNPAFSPDGRQILFDSNRDGSIERYAVDLGGSRPPTRLAR